MKFIRFPLQPGRALAVVLAIAAFSTMIGLHSAPLMDRDEAMQSEVARQIMVTGDVLQLQLNGQPLAAKPPLFFLEMAGFFKVFGVSEVSARLTSAVNGLLFLAALFLIARVLVDTELATLWTLMYASSLLPLVLSRAAVVQPTFNALMALGALCLVAYDEALARSPDAGAENPPPVRKEVWAWLLAAAVALGLAVLAKGPSGGAVPLIAFAGYKVARRGVPLHWLHWVVCGVLSIALALSWDVANFVLHGGAFAQEVARLMGPLLSKSLEGHSGPFYYHWGVALVGLFPWTPLLLLFAVPAIRQRVWGDGQGKALAVMALVWAGFILIVFSIVRTKLPHYSSGMYVPLTLLAALALRGALSTEGRLPLWAGIAVAGYGVAMGVAFAVAPYQIGQVAEAHGEGLRLADSLPVTVVIPGIVLAVGVVTGAGILVWGRALVGTAVIAVAMGACVIGAWRVHLPLVAAYTQGPMIALMNQAYKEGGDLALYQDVSYAAVFYGERDIDMVGTHKFTGDQSRLDTPGTSPLYVITSRDHEEELRRAHPLLVPNRSLGGLVMYRLPAKDEAPGKR
jgi:4-amino-4-deoxy-L-arabinose transferase-like glycosyltransferase